MDNFKKFAVLLTGLLIVVIMVWILSVATQRPAKLTGNHFSEPGNDYPHPSREDLDNNTSFFKPSSPDRRSRAQASDTITWQTASDMESPERSPRIGGKIPPVSNPNKIFVNAAKKILPAVVSIHSSRRVRRSSLDFFSPFLREKDKGDEERDPMPGSGSGIIISSDGYIMTNYHVVEDASELLVTLHDKREYPAEIVGGDPTTDVAVIRVQGVELPPAYIGNSDSVEIGEWVMAVGNPLNFTSTVTTGIVSALGRNIDIIDRQYRYKIENFIQTDAVINPGNSGGALVNLSGEVIGINTAIATRNGFYQGYGFSIPINLAKKIVNDILQHGRVRRAILGVSIRPVSHNFAENAGLPRPMGALIESTTPGSPAESAGLLPNDIVISINGKEVVSVNDLQIKIAQYQPGEQVTLLVWRSKKSQEIDILLGEAPTASVPTITNRSGGELKFEYLGLALRHLSETEKEGFEVKDGLMIDDVAPGSPAAKAGMRRLAVIISVDGAAVTTIDRFEELVDRAKKGSILRVKIKEMNSSKESRIVFVEVPE